MRCTYAAAAIGGGSVRCTRVATRGDLCRAHARQTITVSQHVTPQGGLVQSSQVPYLRRTRLATSEEMERAFGLYLLGAVRPLPR